jgi:hypothetical protein
MPVNPSAVNPSDFRSATTDRTVVSADSSSPPGSGASSAGISRSVSMNGAD